MAATTKITGLTAANVQALDDIKIGRFRYRNAKWGTVEDFFTVRPDVLASAETTATTATFQGAPDEVLLALQRVIASLPGRGHPKASLHAVVRKVRKEAAR